MDKKTQLVKASSGRSSSGLILNAIKNNNLFNYVQTATIEDEVDKNQCFHDLVVYGGVNSFDLKSEVSRCLLMLNKGLADNRKLTAEMIEIITDLVLNDFNGLTVVGFFKCMRKGLRGDYGKVYSLDVLTVTEWIQKYVSGEAYMQRIDELRRKHEVNKNDELQKMYQGDMAELMREALKRTEPKPRKHVPNKKHLEQFKRILPTYSDEELQRALYDYKLRNREAYIEIIETEIKARQKQ